MLNKGEFIMKFGKKIIILVILIISVITIGICFYLLNSSYKEAISLINKNDYIAAYELLDKLHGYKDSDELKDTIYEEYKLAKLKSAEVGDIVLFGEYNGKSEWVVLAKDEDKILVLSKYHVEALPYGEPTYDNLYVTWENSTLRCWLNGTYYDKAFSAEEQAMILECNNYNIDYLESSRINFTLDNIFVLDENEWDNWVNNNGTVLQKLDSRSGEELLRTVYGGPVCVSWKVKYESGVEYYMTGCRFYDILAVRPAMWIDISNL